MKNNLEVLKFIKAEMTTGKEVKVNYAPLRFYTHYDFITDHEYRMVIYGTIYIKMLISENYNLYPREL